MQKTYIFFGPPGSGKGTIANELTKTLGLVHISTGDMFRAEIASKSPLGIKVEELIANGNLVSDELTIDIMKTKLQSIDNKNVILDGFPRTIDQAKALDNMLISLQRKVDIVISLTLSLEIAKERLLGRLVCNNCGASFNEITLKPEKEGICDNCQGRLSKRADDTEDSIRKRFDQYLAATKPVAEYYKKNDLVKEYNADIPVNKLSEFVSENLE